MKLIRALGDISTDISLTAAEKMQRLLALGCEAMGQSIGIISHIENNTYTVIAAHTPDGAIQPGDQFELGVTFCNDTLKAKGIVAYHDAAESPGLSHPCCQSFNLHSYIGIPIRVDNVPYGTLNFSSPEASASPFTELHRDYLTLLAEWVGMMISCKESLNQLIENQAKLEQQNTLFTHICEMASVGAWEHVVATGEIRWSSTLKEMHGLKEDTFISLELASSFTADSADLHHMIELNQRSAEQGVPWNHRYQVNLGQGERKWFETFAKPVIENGRCVRMIGSTQDVTATVDREIMLRQRREEAESALKLRSEFIANISHELRTPIHGVMGMLDALGRTPLSAKQIEYAEIAQQSAASLLSQVNDVLDFSRIDAGLMTFESRELHLNTLIEKQAALWRHEMDQKGLEMVLDLTPTQTLSFMADPVRIGQVLTNLLSNALKFTAKGHIHIATRALQQADNQYLIQLDVGDTGVGIADDKLETIFSPFKQADNSSTRTYGGSGLGLAIVRKIAENYNGGVRVVSEPGKGTVFTVTLQCQQAQPTQASTVAAPGELHHLHVLVAEDNPINQIVIEEQLSSLGVRLSIVGNGEQAVRKATQKEAEHDPFDIIIMDCQMPVMDGYEATRLLRQASERLQEVPIIALTAHAVAGEREKCLNAGMSDFLTKPAGIKQLQRCLLRQLDTEISYQEAGI